MDIVIAQKAHHMTLYIHPTRGLVTKLGTFDHLGNQVNMTDSFWMKFSFVRKTSLQVKDIWKDGELIKLTAVALGARIFSRTRIQGI